MDGAKIFVQVWLAVLMMATGWACTATAAEEKVAIGLLACTLSEPRDAEAVGPAAGALTRQVLCAFKLKNGAEETYVGEVQVLNLSAAEKITLLWRVKVPPTTPPAPGFLEQTYAADPRTPASQSPDLVGEANSNIILHSMADREEGSASAKERSPTDDVAVRRVELKLKSTTG